MDWYPTSPRVKRSDGRTPGTLDDRDRQDIRDALRGLSGAALSEEIARLQARYGVNRNRITAEARRAA